jgi:hypothetical protein
MMRRSMRLGAALAVAAAAPAAAHPGHGAPGAGWLHYLSSPEHALPLALAALGSAAAVALLSRAERRGRHRRA